MADPLAQLLGETLACQKKVISTSSITAERIGLYFSAHWCPPCRNFTPEFAAVYKAAKEQNLSLEVVFVSCDRSEEEFQQYYDSMPWLAVPFEAAASRSYAKTKYGVNGIPNLIILNRRGEVVETEGVQAVRSKTLLKMIPGAVCGAAPGGGTLDEMIASIEGINAKDKELGYRTILTIVNNIIQNPGDSKHKTISKNSEASESTLRHSGFFSILSYVGFKEEGSAFVCSQNPNMRVMEEVRDTLVVLLASLGA